jgi:hypothetical protein
MRLSTIFKATTLGFVLAVSAVFAGPALAQTDQPQVTDLIPQEVPGLGQGKVAVVEGTAGPEGDKFNVPTLSFFQPVSVTLAADRQGDDLKLKLGKFNWDESFMGGSTGSTGYHIDQFRTQGDLLITVTGDKAETPYRLVVWTGAEEGAADWSPVLVPPSQAGGGLTKWLLIGLAVAGLAGAAFYFGRRGRKGAAA